MPDHHSGREPLKQLKSFIRYAISIALTALFLYWAFEGVDLSSLLNAARGASPLWIAALVLITLVTLALRAWRWVVLLRPFAPAVTLWDATIALAICYTGNAVIPRSGEALRAFSLKWKRGTSVSSVMATVVVERIIDLIWLVFLVSASILLLRTRIQEEYPWMGGAMLGALVFCAALIVAIVLVSVYRQRAQQLLNHTIGRLSPRLATVLGELLERFVAGLAALRSPSAYAEIFVSSVILNIGYIFIMYLAFLAFGFHETYDLGAGAALVVMAISSLGFVAPTPGGIGSYHWLFKGSLMLYGVAEPEALACATVVHMVANLSYIVIGGPALLVQRLRHDRKGSAVSHPVGDR